MSTYKLSYHDLRPRNEYFLLSKYISIELDLNLLVLLLNTKFYVFWQRTHFSVNVKGKKPIAVVVIKFIPLSRYKIYIYRSRRLFWWLYRPHWVNQNFIYKISIGFKSKLLEKRLQISVELEINLFSLETFWYSILPVWWTKLQQLSL